MQSWSVKYVHKISPNPNDRGPDVQLPDTAFANRRTLGKALRDMKVLMAGGYVTSFDVKKNEVVVFPAVAGLTTYWHAIILTHQAS